MDQNVPNLFHYAKSELSQDAILAWILMWANDYCKKVDLHTHKLGRDFLELIYYKQDRNLPKKLNVEVSMQKDNIDLLVKVNEKEK